MNGIDSVSVENRDPNHSPVGGPIVPRKPDISKPPVAPVAPVPAGGGLGEFRTKNALSPRPGGVGRTDFYPDCSETYFYCDF